MSGFARDIEGATAIEYALIAGLVSILIVTAVTSVGTGVEALYQRLVDHM